MIWDETGQYAMARHATAFYGICVMAWHGAVCDMAWYGMAWYGMVWYGMVWDGMGRYGSPPASHGFTRRGGGASITIIPAEREDCSRIYIVWVASVCLSILKIK